MDHYFTVFQAKQITLNIEIKKTPAGFDKQVLSLFQTNQSAFKAETDQ